MGAHTAREDTTSLIARTTTYGPQGRTGATSCPLHHSTKHRKKKEQLLEKRGSTMDSFAAGSAKDLNHIY